MPDISQRPHLPPSLSNPMLGGMSIPLGGGSMLPPNPSAAAQVATPNSTAADASGIQQAMAKRAAQDSSADRLSATGTKSGVTYKTDEDGSKTGTSAFDTLDGYMKKAGLNSFQAQFFAGLAENGLDEAQVRGCVKAAGDRFGAEIGLELQQGLSQWEKEAGKLGLARQGLGWLGGKARGLMGYGAKQVAKVAPAVKKVKEVAPKIIPKVKEVATSAANRGTRASRRSRVAVGRKGQAIGRFAAKPGVANAGLGATTGAFNPYTGVGTSGSYDQDGNFDWTNLAANTLGGAALGRVGGAPGRAMMGRALKGETAGYLGGAGANALGHLTGNEMLQNIDGEGLARLGFGAGALSKVPGVGWAAGKAKGGLQALGGRASGGLQSARGALGKSLPGLPQGVSGAVKNVGGAAGNRIAQGARYSGNAMLNNKGRTLAGVGLGGVGAGGLYLGNQASNMMQTVSDTANKAPEMVQTEIKKLRDEYDPQIQEALKGVNEASGKANNMMSGGIGGMLGGEGGWGGILSGLMSGEGGGMAGDIGGYLKENPWLLPLLLSGGGAAGGYALGGKGGAALGGIGAPLLYALMSGQLGSQPAGGGGGKTIDENAAIAKATEDAKVKEQIESGNTAEVPQGEDAPESELARGQKAQAAYSQPNRRQLMLNQGG